MNPESVARDEHPHMTYLNLMYVPFSTNSELFYLIVQSTLTNIHIAKKHFCNIYDNYSIYS